MGLVGGETPSRNERVHGDLAHKQGVNAEQF
jgi:hypothetical protein